MHGILSVVRMQETVSREEQMKGIETMVQLRSHTSPEINVRKVVEDVVNNTIRTGTIVGMPVNQMAESVRDTPEPINLFMGIWHQKEVCILYGDSGCGKWWNSVTSVHGISEKNSEGVTTFES